MLATCKLDIVSKKVILTVHGGHESLVPGWVYGETRYHCLAK